MEPVNYIGYLPVQLALSVVVAVASIILLRRHRGWPAVLLVVGSVAYALVTANNTFFMYAVEYEWVPLGSPVWQHRALSVFENIVGFASVCFPIGFFAFALRGTRASNQPMQRTAPRSDA